MAVIVEDGSGRADANGYVAVVVADAYHEARGNLAWADAGPEDKAAAIIRATANLDATYRSRFPGYPAMGRLQALEWPRIGAFVRPPSVPLSQAQAYISAGYGYSAGSLSSYRIPSDQIPREIVNATCEAALRELVAPGSLAPDLDRGGAITRLKAGSVEVQYAEGASSRTVYQGIDLALSALLLPDRSRIGWVARA